MPAITLELPEDLASRIDDQGPEQLAEIIALGLREWTAGTEGEFTGAAEILEFLAQLPEPAEILELRPSSQLAARVSQLLEKNRQGGLNPREQAEWERYEYLEHLVRMAKGAAALKLKRRAGDV